ncbi:hypothetical protein ACWEO4_24860 [Streptomyces sp. NPDC004393]|uniref:hypothetical protein n=1 Tax=Streptomyces sp. NPDC004533 TaxID=3154278 RepID=UPI0033A68954
MQETWAARKLSSGAVENSLTMVAYDGEGWKALTVLALDRRAGCGDALSQREESGARARPWRCTLVVAA